MGDRFIRIRQAPRPEEEVEPSSVLLWNRPDSSGWGQYKTDMSTKLNMSTLTCRVDARKMMCGDGPTVSGLYRIPGVDWLIAEHEHFSSVITLRFVELDRLPRDNTFGPLNTRSLREVRRRAREMTPPSQKGKFLVKNKPNNNHPKLYRQFSKPPARHLVSTRENIPERPRWRETTGDTRD